MKDGRIEVNSIWPHDRPALRVYAGPFEEVWVFELFEDRALVPTGDELEFPYEPIFKRNAQHVRPRDGDGLYVRNSIAGFHGNGSIVPTG